jgi:hypothetical protein
MAAHLLCLTLFLGIALGFDDSEKYFTPVSYTELLEALENPAYLTIKVLYRAKDKAWNDSA